MSAPSGPRPAGRRTAAIVLAAYLLLFLTLFAQFPAKGHIPGNIDTWYAIAFTNTYLADLHEALGGPPAGSFLYPARNPMAYGETSVALAVLPMALRAAGLGDVGAYYVFISVVYALSAFGAFLVATLYVRRWEYAAFAGLAFAASTFMLSTIDSPHTAFFGVAFISIWLFERWLAGRRTGHLVAAALLAGLQVYLSAYVFLLLGIAVAVLALARLPVLVRDRAAVVRLAVAGLAVALISGPFFISYALKLRDYYSWESQAILFAEFNSLDLQDLLNPMPGNLIWPEGHPFDQRDARALQKALGRDDPSTKTEEFRLMIGPAPKRNEESLWVSSRRRAFVGLLVPLLAIAGLLRRGGGRGALLALAAVSLVLALGPVNLVGDRAVPLPAWLLYRYLPGFHMFRIPGRAFALTLLALVILAARGLETIVDRTGANRRRLVPLGVALLAAGLAAAENVPFPMRSFEAAAFAAPPPAYRHFFSGRTGAVILNLPSGIGYGLAGSAEDLNVFNRELIVMNWQARLGLTIANGVNGYIPESRIRVQKLIASLPSGEAIAALRGMGVGYLVFNKNLTLPGEAILLPGLMRARGLALELDTPTTTVFKVLS